jgi:hypothetical protein
MMMYWPTTIALARQRGPDPTDWTVNVRPAWATTWAWFQCGRAGTAGSVDAVLLAGLITVPFREEHWT